MMPEKKSSELKLLDSQLSACRLCLVAGFEITPGAIFSHPPASDVVLIGQAPGITEVEAQRPFNAGSGRRLFQWLEGAGWQEDDFRSRYVMTAVTKCYPGKGSNGKGDRVPSRAEQKLCRPFLERELAIYRPRLIIPVGGLAIKLFYKASLRLKEIIGTAVYVGQEDLKNPFAATKKGDRLSQFDAALPQDGRWLVPLPHPSGASLWPNKPENKALIDRAVAILGQIRESWKI
jgi:uracil-DNA glycosylase family 4